MDQYVMGVNLQVTSGGPAGTANIPQFNRFLGRMSYLLQGGRHVADVAVLYPIAPLQAAARSEGGQHYAFPPGTQPPNINAVASAREGGIVSRKIDY